MTPLPISPQERGGGYFFYLICFYLHFSKISTFWRLVHNFLIYKEKYKVKMKSAKKLTNHMPVLFMWNLQIISLFFKKKKKIPIIYTFYIALKKMFPLFIFYITKKIQILHKNKIWYCKNKERKKCFSEYIIEEKYKKNHKTVNWMSYF